VVVPDWVWPVCLFVFGSCIGSFLNVVIYRLPRDKSLIRPPSSCPACDRHIHFYDNIPLISWLLLGRKCRYCKAAISLRYFVIELLTALLFAGLFILYFRVGLRPNIPPFLSGGWFIYLISVIMLAAFIAASAIDLELWVIPMSICWFVTVVGLIASSLGVYIIDPAVIGKYRLLPYASPGTASLAVGAAIGLAVSWLLMQTGLIKRSYECDETADSDGALQQEHKEQDSSSEKSPVEPDDPNFNHRLEACREIIFLLPIIIFSAAAYWILMKNPSVYGWWRCFSRYPAIAGFLGGLFGYFVGCGVVWATRILGTFGFGKEAMGLGDVHLMGAAGTVVGPICVVAAFFIAPFFGLAWAGCQMFFKKMRQIPYGPFLSLGIFTVMILHKIIFTYLTSIFVLK